MFNLKNSIYRVAFILIATSSPIHAVHADDGARLQGLPSVEQLQRSFARALETMSPWTLSSVLENMLYSARISRDDRYTQLLIDSGFVLTARTSVATNTPDAYTGETGPVLLNGIYTCGMPAANLVHHGVVWSPIVKAMFEYLNRVGGSLEPTLARKMSKVLSVSMLGLNYFDRHRARIDGRLTYVMARFPHKCRDAEADNVMAGRPVPANFSAAAGDLALVLRQIFLLPSATLAAVAPVYVNNQALYLNRQQQNLDQAMNGVLPYLTQQRDDQVTWKYMPNGRPEDTSHAATVVRFLVAANEARMVSDAILAGLMKTMVATFDGNPASTYSHIEPYLNGRRQDVRTRGEVAYVRGLARWVSLASFDCRAYRIAEQIQTYKNAAGEAVYRDNKVAIQLKFFEQYCR